MTDPSEEDVLVRVDVVSKKFCRSLKRSLLYGVQDILTDLNPFGRVSANGPGGNRRKRTLTTDGRAAPGDRQLREGEFWAVDDVSFELRRGECLGLIGMNGAGKTTLLKMINGLIKPDHGRIEIHGRVGALIALGAGFNPILTGRENILVNASVVGLSQQETEAKLDEIIEFADLRDFIDSPVQNYSSGMQVRLGFAVATALNPDVLILDEVLAVGDAAFRAKCYNRIGKMQKNAAVIFVSHSVDQVARISNRVLVMSKGKPLFLGSTSDGVAVYESENRYTGDEEETFITVAEPVVRSRIAFERETINWNDPLVLKLELESTAHVDDLLFYGVLFDTAGQIAASFTAQGDGGRIEAGLNRLKVRVDNVPLASGSYRLALSVQERSSVTNLVWSYKQAMVVVKGSATGASSCRLPASVLVDQDRPDGDRSGSLQSDALAVDGLSRKKTQIP